ncbi:hypothetical protein [Umezawaea sp. Da 62-37]|uniref:hypothetical protein n=1 Tax=Umezawaea sp. Da 62-37 TaxID=3075927 RepID=UPI0028F70D8C|nr:hypothetical protein [Umezawaea sp. Da 62-37]WNV86605.1 hypothetical protein RM788_52260 [Umezawaea sp. Da 62-37]
MSHVPEGLELLHRAAGDGLIDLVVTERAHPAPSWTGPPDYAELLTVHGSLSCHRDYAGRTPRFAVLDEKGFVALNRELVHQERFGLSTAHLIGFAEAGDDAAWCFDVTVPEYPVYYVHREEPRARRTDTGEWENPADAVVDFPSFDAWFAAMCEAFASDHPPRWFPYLGEPGLSFP